MVDYIIDIGYEGGKGGGSIVAKGTPEELVKDKKSYTAKYLLKELASWFWPQNVCIPYYSVYKVY